MPGDHAGHRPGLTVGRNGYDTVESRSPRRCVMLALIGLLLVIWLAFAIVGAVVKGLAWLLIVGVVLFVATAVVGWVKREALRR